MNPEPEEVVASQIVTSKCKETEQQNENLEVEPNETEMQTKETESIEEKTIEPQQKEAIEPQQEEVLEPPQNDLDLESAPKPKSQEIEPEPNSQQVTDIKLSQTEAHDEKSTISDDESEE